MILMPQIRGVLNHREVLRTLVKRDLRVRYARSVLGYLWTILDPLAMSLIYLLVFTLIFTSKRAGNQPFFMSLIIGMLAWQWFNQSLTETSRALLSEARLVRSTNLPRELWVVRVVLAKGIEYIYSLPVIAFFAAFYMIRGELRLNWTLLFFPIAVLLIFLLATGIGLMLAPVTVLVTDMTRVVRIVIRMTFYATPILYSAQAAPEALQRILVFNPLSGIMELLRTGFFDSQHVSRAAVTVSVVASVAAIIIGSAVFTRLEPAVLKEI